MSGIVNKVKNALHSDNTTTGTHHTTGTTHTGTTHTGTAEGVAGPHSSRVANAADPRIDSDLDGSRGIGGTGYGHTTGTTGSGLTGTGHSTTHGTTGPGLTGTHNTHGTTGTTTTAGPHSSNMANKLDPRVDSDLDGSRNMGATSATTTAGYGSGLTGAHNTHTTGSGLTGTHNTHTNGSGLTGTHNTHTAGSGLTGTHAGNTHGTHTGTTGGISHSTNAGPHDSNLANKVDPRVDSDLDGRGNRHGATTTGAGAGILGAHGSHATAGSGTAQNTAGPHNSDLLNKLDPRVDSDRDGSKTYGGNKTHA